MEVIIGVVEVLAASALAALIFYCGVK